MKFSRFFNFISYSVVASGALSLWVTGGIGIVSALMFGLCAALAWRQEGAGRQISERAGTFLVVAAVPLSYAGWKAGIFNAGPNDSALAGLLGQLILVLSIIKLLQKKTDRDWVFLYLMAFFEVLLSAGITFSPLYLASLVLYLAVVVCAVIAFEMRRSSAKAGRDLAISQVHWVGRLPSTSTLIAVSIVVVAMPLFFLLPRVGGAGFLNSADGLATRTGFTDSVSLGEIGRIQQSDAIVMRVRMDDSNFDSGRSLKWRGVSLDLFDNKTWRSSKPYTDPPYAKLERDYFLLNFASGKTPLVSHTIYLEPLDTPVLFALSRPVTVNGPFDLMFKNSDDNLKFPRRSFERVTYKVASDQYTPSVDRLKADKNAYPISAARFLQLPDDLDSRIGSLAGEVVSDAGAKNRYEKAVAIEKYLRDGFGYTLEMKAQGPQPVADFLFRVREGHCEYFASAMTLMLRSQGIAARVVNGFQQGEYNETADVYIVRQRDAHSWVEVWFPGENAWVAFDPTPSAGLTAPSTGGVLRGITEFLEAVETFWIQYFVSYDNQEQRSLFRSVKSGITDYQVKLSEATGGWQDAIQAWWSRLKGEQGIWTAAGAAVTSLGALLALAATGLLVRRYWAKLLRLPMFERIKRWLGLDGRAMVVEFYQRMLRILERDGFKRVPSQTPLEFAESIGMPEAVRITEKYNAVRFGTVGLSREERNNIELWLRSLESGRKRGVKAL